VKRGAYEAIYQKGWTDRVGTLTREKVPDTIFPDTIFLDQGLRPVQERTRGASKATAGEIGSEKVSDTILDF